MKMAETIRLVTSAATEARVFRQALTERMKDVTAQLANESVNVWDPFMTPTRLSYSLAAPDTPTCHAEIICRRMQAEKNAEIWNIQLSTLNQQTTGAT